MTSSHEVCVVWHLDYLSALLLSVKLPITTIAIILFFAYF
jgi:hypothetical protein